MRTIYKLTFALLITSLLFSCKKYDDYTIDYDYSSVYFGSQKPLRTIVAYDDMQFKLGVVLAGKRENTVNETVTFSIDPTLLNTVPGASAFKLMPANYYTLSNTNTITIPAGKFTGDITVTMNRALFTADPLAVSKTYAIPVRITKSTTDSILVGSSTVPAKDYTIIVVKYISPLHGTYYHKGVQDKLNSTGTVVETNRYTNKDLSKNQTWDLTTLSLNEVSTSGAGNKTNAKLKLTRTNNAVAVSAISGATAVSGSGTYEPVKREFYLNYSFTQGTDKFNVLDTLILRQAPELDLRFEEW
ncbi:MAG TPA: DUF1735 domain-containing protein [Sphingobacteriaceae bacterium]